GEPTRTVRIRADAVLELATTVHVNPTGRPFRLGVAVTRSGHARTLCHVEGAMRGLGNDSVVLERRGDILVARRRRR
ncbi:MAG TPA: hypothetical protein VFH88_14980, partial [Candidatus Krumholzibacteria bacterium]|nr:hypothetical protein [Candidatus Krumholzibacteria bacterium]